MIGVCFCFVFGVVVFVCFTLVFVVVAAVAAAVVVSFLVGLVKLFVRHIKNKQKTVCK